MNLQLKDKRAVVTGSTSGIGFAIAAALAGEGASVVVNGRTQERVDKAVEKLKETVSTADVQGVAVDLSTSEGVKIFTDKIPETDILVNNLGIFEPKEFQDITDDDWLKFFQANVMSGVRLSRYYLPKMKMQDWGRIVFISSESGINIPVEMIHYGVSKSAQLSVSRGLAETTKETNVTVNAILPGPTASEGAMTFVEQMADESGTSKDAMKEQFFTDARPSSLLQRFIEPKEIGNFVAFICSPLSAAINGAALRVDGGVVRSMI